MMPGTAQRLDRIESDSPVAHHAHDRDTESGRETLEIDASVAGGDLVDHRHHQTCRQVQLEELRDEEQRTIQGRGVRNDDERIGGLHALDPTVECVGHDGFVGADRFETVRAREVDDGEFVVADHHRPFASVDRDAGIVRGFRVGAGQGIEDARLACVRAPDDRDLEWRAHLGRGVHDALPAPIGSTSINRAPVRRSASRVDRTS